MTATDARLQGPFYHGTRADLKPGDLIAPGRASNYGSRRLAVHVYLTATLDAAIWGAELAQGAAPGASIWLNPPAPSPTIPI